MATRLYFHGSGVRATTHRGTNTAKLDGTAVGWLTAFLDTTKGSGAANISTNTVAGTTNGVEVASSGTALEWISNPVTADVTISGTITANIWAQESSMNANTAINVVIDILRASTFGADNSNEIVNIVKSTRTTELGFSGANTVQNFTTGMTSGAYTGQTLQKGDRLRIRIFGDDAGTMGGGFTFTVGVAGTTNGADGDSWVEFTETFALSDLSVSGSTLYLTAAPAGIDPGSATELEAWTTRGGSSTNAVTNTVNGWTNGVQITDTAGGTAIEWYSRQLQAFTLADVVQVRLRGLESDAAANASAFLEIAVVASDGTSPTVWGAWHIRPNADGASGSGEISVADTNLALWISGDDLAVTDGQRLRIRVYIDDTSNTAMASGQTVTFSYNGPTLNATGDSWIILTQTVSEFVPATVPRNPAAILSDHAVMMEKLGAIWKRRPKSGIYLPEFP